MDVVLSSKQLLGSASTQCIRQIPVWSLLSNCWEYILYWIHHLPKI